MNACVPAPEAEYRERSIYKLLTMRLAAEARYNKLVATMGLDPAVATEDEVLLVAEYLASLIPENDLSARGREPSSS